MFYVVKRVGHPLEGNTPHDDHDSDDADDDDDATNDDTEDNVEGDDDNNDANDRYDCIAPGVEEILPSPIPPAGANAL